MEHILSLSYGKDSLACLGAIEELGLPLDRIIHAEVWATDTIPADLPPMVEFKAKADKIIKERWGIEVEHFTADKVDKVVREKVTYDQYFYQVMESGKNIGRIKGFPIQMGNWCLKLKLCAFDHIPKDAVQYIGIAIDEPNRFHNLTETKRSPLVEAGWTEAMCREWCEKNDLLSPIYTTATRGGCWFCHNQGVDQLRLLRRNYPEYWELLLKWDNDSPLTFKPDGHTVHDFDKRFQLEDEMCIDPNAPFRWKMLDEPLQIRMF
jgi:3'-phosphoadenosine 5'-phosphosulfate sulfotransferase (PAPS reductase)/FAD synthetase